MSPADDTIGPEAWTRELDAMRRAVRHDDAAIASLIASLPFAEPLFREAVARTLDTASSQRADIALIVGALLRLLDDPDASVRSSAAGSLGSLRATAGLERLRIAVRFDPDWVVRCDAAEALGRIDARSALPALETAMADGSEYVRAYAAAAIARSGHQAEAAFLAKSLRHETSFNARAEIHGALFRLGRTRYLDRLLALLGRAEIVPGEVILNVLMDIAVDTAARVTLMQKRRIDAVLTEASARHPSFAKQACQVRRGFRRSRRAVR